MDKSMLVCTGLLPRTSRTFRSAYATQAARMIPTSLFVSTESGHSLGCPRFQPLVPEHEDVSGLPECLVLSPLPVHEQQEVAVGWIAARRLEAH